MNYVEIKRVCEQVIYPDVTGMELVNASNPYDVAVLDAIMGYYLAIPEIDYEEVAWLLVNYLNYHVIDLAEATAMARKRILNEKLAISRCCSLPGLIL